MEKMKYYLYITNASEHNYMFEYDNLEDAKKHAINASYHNTCILIKGTKVKWES